MSRETERTVNDSASRRVEDEEHSFASRWSRRKRAQQEKQNHAVAHSSETELAPKDAPAQPALRDEDMPPVESLDERSEYAGFLSPEVSEELRKAALKKLFHLAAFNVRDGLDDYDEDFTVFEPLGDTVTADMRHQMERAEERRRAEAEAARSEAEPLGVEVEQTDARPTELVEQSPLAAKPGDNDPLAAGPSDRSVESTPDSGVDDRADPAVQSETGPGVNPSVRPRDGAQPV